MVSLDDEPLVPALHIDPGGAFSFEHDAVHRYIGPHGQVEPVPCLAQVGKGRTHADAVGVVHGYGTDAPGLRVVHVRVVGKAVVPAGLVKGYLGRQPRFLLVAAHRDRAFRAVEVVVYVGVGLRHSEVGQGLYEGPFVVAPRSPVVIVLGDAPQKDLPVNGAGASHHPAPRHRHGCPLFGCGRSLEGPVVGGVHRRGKLVIAELQVVGICLEVGVVRAGLQQKDGPVGVFGQARCQNTSSGPGPYDYDVILHSELLLFSLSLWEKGLSK